MITVIKILAFTVLAGHASRWQDFCERYLVANDPYQFETTSLLWLLRERDRYRAMNEWTYQDQAMFKIITDEIERRK